METPCGLRPFLDDGPFPGGTTANRPLGLGQQSAPLPLVDGRGGDAEAFGNLLRPNGFASHATECRGNLLTRPGVEDYSTDMATNYIAVSGPGSWGGAESAIHAADSAKPMERSKYDSEKVRYVSRCGVKYLTPRGQTWDEIMTIQRCRRCHRLVTKETS